jgi:DNA-directed RNA polymerase subunit L
MKLMLVESDAKKMVIEVQGETHTFLGLLRENAWEAGARQVSYIIRHPYLSEPKLTVRADNPKKVLDSAAQMILDEAKDFEKEFKRASTRK